MITITQMSDAQTREFNSRAQQYNQANLKIYSEAEIKLYPSHQGEQRTPSYSTQQIGDLLERLYKDTIMLAMRDGVRLSTLVYRTPFEKRPTIVVRTPYNKEEFEFLGTLLFLNGYAVVLQDTRGRFESEGEDMVFQSDGWGELQDGYDTIEWVGAQAWSDGNVGIWGYSAIGIAALMAVGASPPHLKCAVAGYAPSKGWGQTAYQGGVFREALVEEWLLGNNSEHMLSEFLNHPQYDDFWQLYDIESRLGELDTVVPILHIGGWYDCFQAGSIQAFSLLNEIHSGEEGNPQQLIMGPWTHVNHYDREQGQVTFPANSIWTYELEETLDWFEYWLKGKNNGILDNPAVTYYVMNLSGDPQQPGNEWKTSEQLPIAVEKVPFYLNPQSGLSQTQAEDDSNTLMQIDSEMPVLTQGGMNLEIDAGPYDQQTIEGRNDVLTFTSEPFSQPVEVVGKITARIFASASVSNFDVSVRISEVFADGRSMLLCDGIRRASFRESETMPSPLPVGEIAQLWVDCWSTAVVINTGSRLRVSLAASNYPRFALNPNQYLFDGLYPVLSEIQIHHGFETPSMVELPVVSGLGTQVSSWSVY